MPTQDFEPSKAVKEYYLFTAKSPVTLGGVTLPGLFSTRNKTPYLLLFILALLLEVYGMSQLYLEGNFYYGFAVLLIILDLIFAFFGHLPEKQKLMLKNQQVLIDDYIRKAQMKKRMFGLNLRQNFFYLLIALLALFKTISYYFFHGSIDALFLLLTVIYILVAIIHIRITGFTIFELIRAITERNEYNKYISDGIVRNQSNIKHTFESETRLNPCSVNHKHSLTHTTDNQYCLETKGILFDDELTALVNCQNTTNAKGILAKESLRHQFENILPAQPIYANQ